MTTPIRRWPSRVLRPQIHLYADPQQLTPTDLLDVVASALTGAGLRVTDRGETGFWASLSPWRRWLMLDITERLRLEAVTGPGCVRVRILDTGSGFGPGKTVARALSNVVAECQRNGVSVTWSEWETAPKTPTT